MQDKVYVVTSGNAYSEDTITQGACLTLTRAQEFVSQVCKHLDAMHPKEFGNGWTTNHPNKMMWRNGKYWIKIEEIDIV